MRASAAAQESESESERRWGAVGETAGLTRATVAASRSGVEDEDGAAEVTAEAAVETAEPAVPVLPMTLEMPLRDGLLELGKC